MRIFSHLLNKFLTEKFSFCARKWEQTTVTKKMTHFLKNYVPSLFIFFEEVFAICNFFTAQYLDASF